jgi:hypothetical protein
MAHGGRLTTGCTFMDSPGEEWVPAKGRAVCHKGTVRLLFLW